MIKIPINMDNQATTPVDPRVLEAMQPFFNKEFGNAASHHSFGARAEEAVHEARRELSAFIHSETNEEIIFTSGATESNNLALKGVAELYRQKGNHIITSAIEHKSVLDTCKYLESRGFRVTYLPVNSEGLISLEELRGAITDETILISVMYANNEIGVLQPISEIGSLAKERGIFFHSDIAQAAGKIPVDVQVLGIDLASFSAHKMYGPKGVGVLYVRRKNPRVRLEPQIHGGGHEYGLRSGTLNVPAIVGFGKAARIAREEMREEVKRIFDLREKLRMRLASGISQTHVNGSLKNRLPGNLNMSFAFVEGEAFLAAVSEEIAVSSGSACTSAVSEPSYVLKALGLSEEFIHTSIRFGIGRFNTEEEIEYAADCVIKVVKRLRELSPLYEVHKKENESNDYINTQRSR